MNRQIAINGMVSGVIGYASVILWQSEHAGLAILVVVAWFIGMNNSLIPSDNPKGQP